LKGACRNSLRPCSSEGRSSWPWKHRTSGPSVGEPAGFGGRQWDKWVTAALSWVQPPQGALTQTPVTESKS